MKAEPKPVRHIPGVIAFLIVSVAAFLLLAGSLNWSLFGFVPIAAGFAQGFAMARSARRKVSLGEVAVGLIISHTILSAAMILLAYEGLICLVMAAPLSFLISLVGAVLGLAADSVGCGNRPMLSAPIFLLPFAVFAMDKVEAQPMRDEVRSELAIQATPDVIWPLLQNLDLPRPTELPFRAGVAHPVQVRTRGADRVCVLSTGNMPERVLVSEPGKRLLFEVLDTPATMKEMSPYDLNPKHLHGYFECLEGEFTLHLLPNGTTVLRGRSLYQCRFAPHAYWRLWTRKIVSDTQMRVMREVKRQAEARHR